MRKDKFNPDETFTKTFGGVRFKAAATDDGIVEAIVSVFGNVDSYNERVMPGAFTESLGRKLPKGVWMHDWMQPIAKTIEAKELAAGDPSLPDDIKHLGGLYVKAQFNLETQIGKESFSNIKTGIIDEFSIGYSVKKWSYDEDTNVWDLNELDLYEWSPVLVGANRATALVSAKDFGGRRFAEQLETLQADVLDCVSRIEGLKTERSDRKKWLSDENMARAQNVLVSLEKARDALAAALITGHGEDADQKEQTEEMKRIKLSAFKYAATLRNIA